MEQLLDNTGYMADFKPLSEDEKAPCIKAAAIINNNITVPCTGCEYCVGGCPKQIPIPYYFSLYNADLLEVPGKGWTPQMGYYGSTTDTKTPASGCIKCGKCENICPQHLPIRKYLDDVANHFGK